MPPEDLNMAAHQHLKTNTHTHPAATNSEAVCLLHKGAAARTPPDSSTRTVITFFRYFHFFDLLLLFFGLFLVLNFFFYQPRFCRKNGASVSKRGQFRLYNRNLHWCIQNCASASLHTPPVDVLLTRPYLAA